MSSASKRKEGAAVLVVMPRFLTSGYLIALSAYVLLVDLVAEKD